MKNLYLIGMMGCGKTTIAHALGETLSRPVLDTDAEIERETDLTVDEIFSQKGEAFFRDLETALCRRLADSDETIVATGGGLPLREENRLLLRKSGTVIFLNRDPKEIFATADMSLRPLGRAGEDAFLRRFAEREPLYRAAAHLTINNFVSVRETAAEILTKLEELS